MTPEFQIRNPKQDSAHSLKGVDVLRRSVKKESIFYVGQWVRSVISSRVTVDKIGAAEETTTQDQALFW